MTLIPVLLPTQAAKFLPYSLGQNPTKRKGSGSKVIQISTMVHREKDWAFIALCNDGSLWPYHGFMVANSEYERKSAADLCPAHRSAFARGRFGKPQESI